MSAFALSTVIGTVSAVMTGTVSRAISSITIHIMIGTISTVAIHIMSGAVPAVVIEIISSVIFPWRGTGMRSGGVVRTNIMPRGMWSVRSRRLRSVGSRGVVRFGRTPVVGRIVVVVIIRIMDACTKAETYAKCKHKRECFFHKAVSCVYCR